MRFTLVFVVLVAALVVTAPVSAAYAREARPQSPMWPSSVTRSPPKARI